MKPWWTCRSAIDIAIATATAIAIAIEMACNKKIEMKLNLERIMKASTLIEWLKDIFIIS